jgi:FixJ family two-component response regulator/GAF domain-containing protein
VSGRHARVLIVDDSPEDLATYTRWLLACDERSLTVFTASSLESALDMCRTCRPECIVLDYDLRETTGLEVMAELRRHGFDTPIIAITGNGSEAIAVEFMKAGARDYLTKTGVTAHELCSAVVALLSPHTVRQQLTLYRQRERTINAELALALERVSFLAETGKLLAATLDYREVIGLALTRAMPFLAQACIVDILEEGMIQRHDAYVDDWAAKGTTNQLRMRLPTAEGASFPVRTIRAGMPLYFAHAALIEAARDDVDLRVLLERGLVAAAFLPLRCTGPALGVLTLLSTRPDAFTGMERALCEDYAQRVAVALANVRIVEAERVARERAEAARRRLTFQSRISSLFAQSLDWENALQKLMKLVTAAFCDTAAIFTIAESSRSLGLRAVASVNADLETAINAYF